MSTNTTTLGNFTVITSGVGGGRYVADVKHKGETIAMTTRDSVELALVEAGFIIAQHTDKLRARAEVMRAEASEIIERGYALQRDANALI